MCSSCKVVHKFWLQGWWGIGEIKDCIKLLLRQESDSEIETEAVVAVDFEKHALKNKPMNKCI